MGRSWPLLGHHTCSALPVLAQTGLCWRSFSVAYTCTRAAFEENFGSHLVFGTSLAVLWRLGAVGGRLGEHKTLIFLIIFNDFSTIDVLSKNDDLDWS